MAFCTKCGIPIPEGAMFCSGCGSPVAVSTGPPGTGVPKKADKMEPYWYLIIWSTLLVPFVGSLFVILLSSRMYYDWRKEFPKKAKVINKHGFLAFFAGIALWLYVPQLIWR